MTLVNTIDIFSVVSIKTELSKAVKNTIYMTVLTKEGNTMHITFFPDKENVIERD